MSSYRPLIGFPNRADDGSLSGGGWESALPLTNLQDRRMHKVARSTDATKANTQLALDLGAGYPIRCVGLHRHNLSLDALVRVRGRPDETGSRTGTAKYRDEDGVLAEAASGEIRHWHYAYNADGVLERATLLEGSRTNELTQSEDLTHADWAQNGLSARNADQAGDPTGGTGLDELVEDGGDSTHVVQQAVTLTADETYVLAAWAMANTRTELRLELKESAATANRVRAFFDLAAGAKGSASAGGTGALERSYIEDWTDVKAGLYLCVLIGSVGNGATGITADIALTDGNEGLVYTGDGSSSLYAGFAQVEDAAKSLSSYIPTTTAADSRSDDLVQYDIDFSPRTIEEAGGATFYARWKEMGTAITGAFDRYWQIGGPGTSSVPRFLLETGSGDGQILALFQENGGSPSSTLPAGTISLFDDVEARVVIFQDGSDWKVQLHVAVNGGTETSATASPSIGNSLPDSWSADTLTIGAAPGGSQKGFAAFFVPFMGVEGVKTMAEMRDLAAGDEGVLAAVHPYDSQWQSAFPAAFPTSSKLWGEDRSGESLSQDDLDSMDHADYALPLPENHQTRHWTVEIDDTTNSDGYVELGRLFVAQAYRPSAGIQAGAEIGYQESTDRVETPGGAFIYDARNGRRVVNIDFALIDEDEALVNWLEIQRRIGMSEQFLFVWDPDDVEHLWRRTFVGSFRSLFPASYPNSTLRMNQRFQIVEEL